MRQWLLRSLSEDLVIEVRRVKTKARVALLMTIARFEFIARIYYGLVSKSFGREARGVLAGKLRYYQNDLSKNGNEFKLRRDIHRLEKGLSMEPLRETFAGSYIGGIVETYAKVRRGQEDCESLSDNNLLRWAESVLEQYFLAVTNGKDARIDRARDEFARREGRCAFEKRDWNPYRAKERSGAPLNYDSILSLVRWRRSVRWFEDRVVPREVFLKAAEVATQAPSACNRQPFYFRFFDDPKAVARVSALPPGVRGISRGFRSFVVVVGRLEAYFDEKDRHLIYIDGALASMLLILGLESLGVSSCCINWPDSQPEERKIVKELGLPPHERVVMCIALGYARPEGKVPYSGKKTASDLVKFN